MSEIKTNYGGIAILVFIIFWAAFWIHGCEVPAASYAPTQSWDQENLKRHDVGCPTAVFVAPHGNLEQCQTEDVCPSGWEVTQGQTGTTCTAPKSVAAEVAHSTPKGFPTLEAAATAALSLVASKATSTYYEWGGNLAKDIKTGEFYFSAPQTSMHGDHVHINDDDPGTLEVVGTYHTHPCLPHHEPAYFSTGDMESTLYGHEVTFMGDLCTGKVHEFKPGDKPDVTYLPKANVWLTEGRVLGAFTEPRTMLAVE